MQHQHPVGHFIYLCGLKIKAETRVKKLKLIEEKNPEWKDLNETL